MTTIHDLTMKEYTYFDRIKRSETSLKLAVDIETINTTNFINVAKFTCSVSSVNSVSSTNSILSTCSTSVANSVFSTYSIPSTKSVLSTCPTSPINFVFSTRPVSPTNSVLSTYYNVRSHLDNLITFDSSNDFTMREHQSDSFDVFLTRERMDSEGKTYLLYEEMSLEKLDSYYFRSD